MECVIRLLWDCMFGVEKTAVKWRLEDCGKVDKYLKTSPLDWLNFDVSFQKLSLNPLHYLLTPPQIWMRKWDEMAKLNISDIEDSALDTEFNLTPKECLWQDQTNFFKLVNEAFKYDFESEEGFTFCASPPFNTLSTEKLKEIVSAAKKTFKWQSSKEGQTPSKIGYFQGLWHWDQFTGKSVVTLTPTSKWSMRRRWTQRYLVCANTKFSIRSPEVTEELWFKFNTVRRGEIESDS